MNKVYDVLKDKKYLGDSGLGNTVVKIKEDNFSGNVLLVATDNAQVRNILTENKKEILNTISAEINLKVSDIVFI